MRTDTERLEFIAQYRVGVLNSDYLFSVAMPSNPREPDLKAWAYHSKPLKGEAEVFDRPTALRKAIDELMQKYEERIQHGI